MSVDIVIIDGGIVGSAVTYFLARTGRAGKVAVIEPDPNYAFSATPAVNGGVRQQLGSLSPPTGFLAHAQRPPRRTYDHG